MEFLSKRLSNGRQLSIKVFNSYIKGIKGIVCMSVQLQIFRKYFRLPYINEGESIHYCSLLGSKVSIFACESLSLLYNFVINIFAVTINFLISLLFTAICSYLNQWSSLFVPPILNSVQLQQEGGRETRLGGGTDLGSIIPKPQHLTA